MLCSESAVERRQGVHHIMSIRGPGDEKTQVGDMSVRIRKTPEINPDAKNLDEMIDWSEAFEPVLTCHLTSDDVKKFVYSPMEVPDWPCHGQSIERRVKQVTEAASKVFSHEKRDGYIRGQELSRRIMSKNQSKKDLINLTNF